MVEMLKVNFTIFSFTTCFPNCLIFFLHLFPAIQHLFYIIQRLERVFQLCVSVFFWLVFFSFLLFRENCPYLQAFHFYTLTLIDCCKVIAREEYTCRLHIYVYKYVWSKERVYLFVFKQRETERARGKRQFFLIGVESVLWHEQHIKWFSTPSANKST